MIESKKIFDENIGNNHKNFQAWFRNSVDEHILIFAQHFDQPKFSIAKTRNPFDCGNLRKLAENSFLRLFEGGEFKTAIFLLPPSSFFSLFSKSLRSSILFLEVFSKFSLDYDPKSRRTNKKSTLRKSSSDKLSNGATFVAIARKLEKL